MKVLFCIQLDTGYRIPNIKYKGIIFLQGALIPEHYYNEDAATIIALDESVHDIRVDRDLGPLEQETRTTDGSNSISCTVAKRMWHGHNCVFKLEREKVLHDLNDPHENLFLTAIIDHKCTVKYYIMHELYWRRVMTVFNHNNFVIVKNKKTFLGVIKSGQVLGLLEILDEMLLNYKFLNSDRGWLLPVQDPHEEQKLLAGLNLLGLYGQVKGFDQAMLLVLTIVTIVLQFSSRVRAFLYQLVNRAMVWCARSVVDRLSLGKRRFIYSLGTYWSELVPSNDCEARVISSRPSFTQWCKNAIDNYCYSCSVDDALAAAKPGESQCSARVDSKRGGSDDEEEEEEEEAGVIKFFSVGNVRCNDLIFVKRIVPEEEFPDDFEVGESAEGSLFWGKTEGRSINIKWGHHQSLLHGVQDELMSHARALIYCYNKHKSGAIYSKQGSCIKVWSVGMTLSKLLNAPSTPIINIWKAKHATIR